MFKEQNFVYTVSNILFINVSEGKKTQKFENLVLRSNFSLISWVFSLSV